MNGRAHSPAAAAPSRGQYGTDAVHLVVETLAGSAAVSVHQAYDATRCAISLPILLDPADVLAMAKQLTEASVPPAPVKARQVSVRRVPPAPGAPSCWYLRCPECFPLKGTYQDQPAALAAAWRHLQDEHGDDAELRARLRSWGLS